MGDGTWLEGMKDYVEEFEDRDKEDLTDYENGLIKTFSDRVINDGKDGE